MEIVLVLWTFYILLMIAYGKSLFGDRHPFTYFVFAGSLIWSLYLIIRLLKYKKIAPAIRYAIPTVVIFWTSVEILGRWNFFKEIWIEPTHYLLEMGLILVALAAVIVLTLLKTKEQGRQ